MLYAHVYVQHFCQLHQKQPISLGVQLYCLHHLHCHHMILRAGCIQHDTQKLTCHFCEESEVEEWRGGETGEEMEMEGDEEKGHKEEREGGRRTEGGKDGGR